MTTGNVIEVNVEINSKEIDNAEEPNDEIGEETPATGINSRTPEHPIKVQPTNEEEIVDVEGLDTSEALEIIGPLAAPESLTDNESSADNSISNTVSSTSGAATNLEQAVLKKPIEIPSDDDNDIEVQLRNIQIKNDESKLSTSFPTQRSLWPFDSTSANVNQTPILGRGSLNFSEILSGNLRRDRDLNMRHSISTSLARHQHHQQQHMHHYMDGNAANDTISMIRGVSSCSKDTLLYIDQQNHRALIEEETSYMGNRSLWVCAIDLLLNLLAKKNIHFFPLFVLFTDITSDTA